MKAFPWVFCWAGGLWDGFCFVDIFWIVCKSCLLPCHLMDNFSMCRHDYSICSHHNVSSNVNRPRRNSSLQCIIHVDKKDCKASQKIKWWYCLQKGPFIAHYSYLSLCFLIYLFPKEISMCQSSISQIKTINRNYVCSLCCHVLTEILQDLFTFSWCNRIA